MILYYINYLIINLLHRLKLIMIKNKKTSYYAVKNGFQQGVFTDWNECKKQVMGYKGAIYKKFDNFYDAQTFINSNLTEIKSKPKNNSTTSQNNDLLKAEISSMKTTDKLELIDLSKLKKRNDYYYIFTDGSKQKNHCGYAIYLPNCINYAEKIDISNTNNIAELNAILKTTQLLINQHDKINKANTIFVISDSEYCIKCITIWSKKWKNNNWLTSQNTPVQNWDLIENITNNLEQLRDIDIKLKFSHQYSHKKAPQFENSIEYYLWKGNYIVDHLAAAH